MQSYLLLAALASCAAALNVKVEQTEDPAHKDAVDDSMIHDTTDDQYDADGNYIQGKTYDVTSDTDRSVYKKEYLKKGTETTDEELKAHTDAVIAENPYDTSYGNDGEFTYEVEDNPTGDGSSRPLCYIAGFENQTDNQGPSDQCCRVYEYNHFMGRFRDFCFMQKVYDPPTAANGFVSNFEDAAFNDKVYQLDDMGWANDINSFKCGQHAYLELCKYPGDLKSNQSQVDPFTTTWNDRKDHCIEGYLENRGLAEDADEHDQLTLKLLPEHEGEFECVVATVYNKPGCSGKSLVVRPDIVSRPDPRKIKQDSSVCAHAKNDAAMTNCKNEHLWRGSDETYDASSDDILESGKVNSIRMASGCAMELFNDDEFTSDSWTLRMPPGNGEVCTNSLYIPPTNAYMWARGKGETQQFPNKQVALEQFHFGFYSLIVRNIYFPESWAPSESYEWN